jgi:hypothetical protein
MKSKWIEHDGKQILYIDLSNFRHNDTGFEKELSEAVSTIGMQMYEKPPHSVLVLVDLRDTMMTQKTNTLLSERIKDTKKYVLRTAVVGMTGIRKMFLDFFAMLASSETGSFEEPEAAKAWLVKAP